MRNVLGSVLILVILLSHQGNSVQAGPGNFLFFPLPCGATPVTAFLTTSSTNPWAVPANWNSANNTIEVIGGGGAGEEVVGGGGGGGAILNL